MTFRPTTALALALAIPSTALAATAGDPATELDEVLVTATRTRIALRDSLSPAQVIDRAEIERSQSTSLQQLLAGRAGINLTNTGGLGKQTSLFLRGAGSNQLLVMIDGVRVGSKRSGGGRPPAAPSAPFAHSSNVSSSRFIFRSASANWLRRPPENSARPSRTPATSFSIASGWSPAGGNVSCSRYGLSGKVSISGADRPAGAFFDAVPAMYACNLRETAHCPTARMSLATRQTWGRWNPLRLRCTKSDGSR